MNLANNLTLLRMLLVPVFIGCLFYYEPSAESLRIAALLIFIFACATDALDGYVARKRGQVTKLGSYIDPLADKMLLIGAFACMGFMTHLPAGMRIPAWVAITVISRDALILIGAILIYLMSGTLRVKPLLIGKTTTFFQMLTVLGALLMSPEFLRQILFTATFALTVWSGLKYLRMGTVSINNR